MPEFRSLPTVGSLGPGSLDDLNAALNDAVLTSGTYFTARQMDNAGANDAITVAAPLSADSVTPEIYNRLFDDTAEEAVTLRDLICPAGAVSIRLTTFWRPITGVDAKTLRQNAYGMTTSGAPGAWSSAEALSDVSIVANQDWIETTDTIAIGDLNIVAGAPCLVQISRNPTGDDLVGDAALQAVAVEWA